MKKFFAILLTVTILLSVFAGMEFFSVSAGTSGYYTYSVFNNKATITKVGTQISGDINIPDTLGGYSVTSIGDSAFNGCTKLTSITIPDSVTWIGYNAFSGCTGLKSVTIPDSVTSIGSGAFYNCAKLTSITIPNSVTSIGDSAFSGCTGLTSITIPDSVTSIGSYAFYGCTKLTSITIPDSVTSIGSSAFYGCTGLESINVSKDNIVYHSSGNCLIETESKTLVAGCKNSKIPIGDSVTSIGEYAFYGCTGLMSITIPDSVTSIGSYAFYGCTGLTSITIPDSVTTIGSWAFNNTPWFYNQPDGLVYAGKVAYEYKGTCPSSVIIENGTLGIAGCAFYNCTGLTSITIPDSVTSIGRSAFSGCTGLTSITIPDSVTSIGSSAFNGCTELTSITIPDSVTSIGEYAFYGCTGLMSVTIGNSVTSIGSSAFRDCTGLTSITIPDSVTSIGNYAFYNCTGLTSIIIPDSVNSIGSYAFSGCTGLTSATIGNSVTSIGGYAFYRCTGLTSATIGNSVTSIGEYAFYGCTGLMSITIPDSVTSIGFYAFSSCTGLTSIMIPDSVTSIDNYAFYCCDKLKDVFYKGTTQQKAKISIANHTNSPLTKAIWHYIVNLNYKPATCTEAGYTGDMGWEGYEVVKYGEKIPALGHDYIAIITEPTCTAQGYTTYTCSRCGDSYIDSYTNELGHNYNPVISDPTCTARGYTTHTCSRCGDTYKDNYTYMPCGENAGFIIKNNTLYIHGAGETNNWKTQGSIPWYDLAAQIKEVIIDEGITKIGTYAFYCLNNLESVICKNEDLEFGRYALNTANENLTVYSKNGALTEYCGNNGIRFIDVTATPELVEVTANSLTVKAVSGYEYSKDTVNWQTSGVFIGLSPVTEYNIYARLIKTKDEFPGKISEPLTVTTDKASVSAPPKPVCIRNTDTEITLKANGLYEYSIDGENWQKSNVFTGLIHKNTYLLYQRVAETETEYASAPSAPLIMQLVKKTVSTPAAPDYQSHTDNSITVIGNPAYEYSIDGENWQTSATFENLNKNIIYRIYARVAETETEYASEPSAALIIALPGTPVACGTEDTITVKSIEGFEYCLDDFVWQDNPSFDMLLDNTDYMVYQRLKAINGEKVYLITSEPTVIITDNSTSVHRYNAVITEPTCTEKGFTTYTCEKCGKTFVDNYVTVLGHDYKAAVTQPTCTARGYTTYTCSRCGDSYIDDYTAALNHSHTEIRGAFAATCTENGYTGDTYCLDCGEKIAGGETISALGHSFGDWTLTTAPTCTEKGVEKRVCSRDHDHIETRDVNALGHNYQMVVTPPTCTEQGYTTHTCSRCGDCYIDNYTNALNHLHTEIRNAVITTCTENGYTGDMYCLDCGEKIATGEKISVFGHKYNAATTPPTCTARGYTTYTCEKCGDSYIDDYINATGHTVGEWVKDIEKHWHICSDCGERLDEANHTESDWITDSEALPGVVGLRHKECTVCGHVTETEIIPALAAYKSGDINGDGEVDNKDLTRLFQYLSNWEVDVNETALDVNGDGSVDNKDLTRLFQYLSNWDVEVF